MSFGDAMQAIGRGAGLNQARGFARQNRQDEMNKEEHGKRMQALDTNLELGEMQVDQTRTQMKRDELTYKQQQDLLEAKKAFDAGTLKFAAEGDPSQLISAYNQHIPDGDSIVGFEMVEGKEGEPPKYKLKFKEGGERVLDRQALGGLGKALSNPDMILEIEENRRQQLAEQQAALEKERRALAGEKELETHKTDESIRESKAISTHEQELEQQAGAEPRELKTTDSNYFKSYMGSLMGGKFNEFGGMILEEDAEENLVKALPIAEKAWTQNPQLTRSEAASIGYAAVKGEVSPEEAKKAAKEEYEAKRAAGEEMTLERDEYINNRAEAIIDESRWAQKYVKQNGLDQLGTASRQSAINTGQAPAAQNESPDIFSYVEP